MTLESLPVAVIGGGPVGLAAAAHLVARGLPVKVFEAGTTVGANLREWGHVRVFTPWELNVDAVARALLERQGWTMPPLTELPTGSDLYARYLKPLSETPELAAAIEVGTRVEAISRLNTDKVKTEGREAKPFQLRLSLPSGAQRVELARAAIDASGTWAAQNPMGANGLPALGEADNKTRIAYGMPNILGHDRATYAGHRTLVVGSGYSAANVLLDLAKLAEDQPDTSIIWAVRGTDLVRVYGGGLADQLPARGELGWLLKGLVERGVVTLVTGFATTRILKTGDGLVVEADGVDGPRSIGAVDRIVVATGQRPDLIMTRELRLELDPWLESVRALGPLIDPNLHSCGDVPPHGHRELSHPEPGFYTVGVKSYGRAPTFLLLTGYEQVRSVVAAIAGDLESADRIQLALPETGICKVEFLDGEMTAAGCCGGPAITRQDACCVADAVAKDAGQDGCGCGLAA
ncbi:FAD-dependent oxidoreductase [Acidisoma sp. S159]|uniref:FAD-dependent oxidoreductase n=1 Tax=Acidisoma sp. S159 TaxID=1747225 RepID=UPI00131DB00B|nr:FAD-dependent oxidoreductase [Acidisoma sp. S159]